MAKSPICTDSVMKNNPSTKCRLRKSVVLNLRFLAFLLAVLPSCLFAAMQTYGLPGEIEETIIAGVFIRWNGTVEWNCGIVEWWNDHAHRTHRMKIQ